MPYFKSDVTSESSKKLFTVISTFAVVGAENFIV